MKDLQRKSVAIIVAHPDDETLWAGGTILQHPLWTCFIVCLCRKSDAERAPRFYAALAFLQAEGIMGDQDDGPEQVPLDEASLQNTILDLLPARHYDLVITHNPSGEYTKHRRHEETGKAVILLWNSGKISASELRTFAYEDGARKYFPKAVQNAPIHHPLPDGVWLRKFYIISTIYGFESLSWEAQTTPREESFWLFRTPQEALMWLDAGGVLPS